MKPKNKRKRLASRQANFENNKTIQSANQRHPGAYTKPGSMNK